MSAYGRQIVPDVLDQVGDSEAGPPRANRSGRAAASAVRRSSTFRFAARTGTGERLAFGAGDMRAGLDDDREQGESEHGCAAYRRAHATLRRREWDERRLYVIGRRCSEAERRERGSTGAGGVLVSAVVNFPPVLRPRPRGWTAVIAVRTNLP